MNREFYGVSNSRLMELWEINQRYAWRLRTAASCQRRIEKEMEARGDAFDWDLDANDELVPILALKAEAAPCS